MEAHVTKQKELFTRLETGETLTVEITQQLNGLRVVYLRLDGTSIVRAVVPADAHLITIEPADLPATESLIDIN